MDSESSSKILHNSNEFKEIINEETMKVQEYISDVERLHQRMLDTLKELIELLQKEGKRKDSSLTMGNNPMEETNTIPRIFRQKVSPSPFSRPMASSTLFT
ncbi:hypothetical protein O181_000317 [Austropuccinia psidii MF-1]|uniref:Uncharacterized protein n=1 Tax=Austropuccinia psidii MF-1 TaxID=1389203 RepID=A0A9Q3GBY8_9BASI|nr:hypothetical protein [Austropuccinia psidii MF-1]